MKFGKNARCNFFTDDCNESFGIINLDRDTNRKSIFPNEFCASRSKITYSSGRQSRVVCENYYDSDDLTRSDSNYKRDDLINGDKSWKDYGNDYADYCPISLCEEQVGKESETKYSYIVFCKLREKENYGNFAFDYWLKYTSNYDYSVFTPNLWRKF